MSFRITLAVATLAILASAGCIGKAPLQSQTDLDRNPARTGIRANVLTANQLQHENGPLLEVMTRRVSNIQVDNRFSCPAITLRGNHNTVPGITEPLVYVDGIRTVDTCILNLMSASDVDRVEIYPMGFTERAGYANNSHGLILVFTRSR
jgi:hypothetical protein